MSTSRIAQKSLIVSYLLFFVVLVSYFCFMGVFASRKGDISVLPLAVLVWGAFLWPRFG